MAQEVKTHKDLVVWQKAFALVKCAYEMTEGFPEREKFGLSSQIRRAAVSIPSNIAEGRSRGTKKEYAQFVTIAYGSAAEMDTLLLLAADLGYIEKTACQSIVGELEQVSRMLNKMKHSLRG